MSSSDASDPTTNPSMLHGHATYVAGAAKVPPSPLSPCLLPPPQLTPTKEVLGIQSGTSDKEYAVSEMRAAKEQSGGEVGRNETMGKAEETLGKVTGCEGMRGEGRERQG